jgi:hypothetical protein
VNDRSRQPPAARRLGRSDQERRLRQVEFLRDRPHLGIGQRVGVRHYRKRVPGQRLIGKDINEEKLLFGSHQQAAFWAGR